MVVHMLQTPFIIIVIITDDSDSSSTLAGQSR
jgi:hypothetical protein